MHFIFVKVSDYLYFGFTLFSFETNFSENPDVN
jgi:hypothetical protein